jgi:plastocyanin
LAVVMVAAGMVWAGERASTAAGKPAATAPAGNVVTIDNFRFSPAEITVKAGATVTWTNKDDVPHTATSTMKPRTIDSKTLDTDESYSCTFKAPGRYPYFCAVHPHMTGVVIVK